MKPILQLRKLWGSLSGRRRQKTKNRLFVATVILLASAAMAFTAVGIGSVLADTTVLQR
jgi:hypothetical protein